MNRDLDPRVHAASPPRWAFGRGALVGFVVGIPTVALSVMVLARLGIGDPSRSVREVLRLTLIFAGAPLVLTTGGIARVAARAASAGTAHSWRAGALTGAGAGPGFMILAAIPIGSLPESSWGWLWYLPAGAVPGAAIGLLIALSVAR